MDQVTQPQNTVSDDVLKVAPVDQGLETLSINSPGDHGRSEVEDHSHEKKSLISKMKDTAKDKMHKAKDKLKAKLKKDNDTNSGQNEGEDSDDVEVHPEDLRRTPTQTYATDGSYVNHGKPRDTFGVNPTKEKSYSSSGDEELQREYDGFLRSSKGETDSTSPLAPVDAIMPPPVISPESTSDLGEKSSISLGEIPENSKEEDKVVATEGPNDHFRSTPSFGTFGDTTQDKLRVSDEQKDLEARERDPMSQELADGSKKSKFTKTSSGSVAEQPREESRESFGGKADRQFLSTEPAAVSSVAEKGSERPLADPNVEIPVPQHAEITESMFSSYDADDLRDRADSKGQMKPEESQGPGVSGRDFKYEEGNLIPSNSRASFVGDEKVQGGTQPTREQEQFHDPQLDESSLEKQASGSVKSYEDGEEKGKLAQDTY